MASDECSNTLRQIARLLDVPMSAFYDPQATSEIGSAAQAAQERYELLEAFAQVSDPQVRRECIEFVRAKMSSAPCPTGTALTADQT